jgi:hypothetical protein
MNFWTSWVTTGFSRRALLHGIPWLISFYYFTSLFGQLIQWLVKISPLVGYVLYSRLVSSYLLQHKFCPNSRNAVSRFIEALRDESACRLQRGWPSTRQGPSRGTPAVVCFTMGKNLERRSRTVLAEPPVRHNWREGGHQGLSSLPWDRGEISVWIGAYVPRELKCTACDPLLIIKSSRIDSHVYVLNFVCSFWTTKIVVVFTGISLWSGLEITF